MNETKQEREERIRREVEGFAEAQCPYGWLDMKAAIEHFDEYGLSWKDLDDALDEFVEATDSKKSALDVCYVAYDHILQLARNKLCELIDFDICNDTPNEIYTFGNYCATSYDYSEEDIEALEEALKKLDSELRETILDDEILPVFLEELDIDLKELWGVQE